MFKKKHASLFVSDNAIQMTYLSKGKEAEAFFKHELLPNGIIQNGSIIDPKSFLKHLTSLFKASKMRPKSIKLVIHDQNILVRTLEITKSALKEKNINQYLKEDFINTIKHPFKNVTLSYAISNEDETTYTISLLLADRDLLEDYCDIFNRLFIYDIQFDSSLVSLFNIFNQQHQEIDSLNGIMLVSLYDYEFGISIFENGLPAFNMIEEYPFNERIETIDTYIDRIANYYKYNLKKGKKTISQVIVYILSDQIDINEVERKIIKTKVELKGVIYENSNIKNLVPQTMLLPFSALTVKHKSNRNLLPFDLNRPSIRVVFATYLLLSAFIIFSLTTLFYIPMMLSNDMIIDQQNRNDILKNYYNILKNESELPYIPSQIELDYSLSFEQLNDFHQTHIVYYLESLISILPNELSIESISVDQKTNMITLLVFGNDQLLLNEYVILIYETFGVTTEYDMNRFILITPTKLMLTSSIMEVKIRYA